MTSIFCTYFFVLILMSGSLWGFGSLIFKLLSIDTGKTFTSLFAKFVLACTFFVLMVSVYYTKGLTVNIFLLPIISIFFYLNRKNKEDDKVEVVHSSKDYHVYLFLIIGLSAFFLLRFGQVYNPSSGIPLAPHSDIVFYANCIDFLTQFGRENSSADYVFGAESGTSPYHYYELWFGAGVSRLFGLNTALSLVLVTFTISLFVIWLGFCAILEHYKKVNIFDALLCFGLVFLTGIAFHFYTHMPFMKYIYVFAYNAWNYPKLFPIYFYAISALLFFLNKKNIHGILCLLVLPIVSISTAIGVFVGIACWVVFSYVFQKRNQLNVLVIVVAMALGLFSFYSFLTVPTSTHVSVSVWNTLQSFASATFLNTSLNVCVGATVQIMLLYLPFLMIFYAFDKRWFMSAFSSGNAFYVFVFIYLFSLIGWGLLYDKLSSTQVFVNVSQVVLNLVAALIIIKIWTKEKKLLSMYRLVIFIFIGVGAEISTLEYRKEYDQSGDYIQAVTKETRDISALGAFVLDEQDYRTMDFSYVSNFGILGHYLIYAEKRTFPLSISPFSYPLSTSKELSRIELDCLKNTPFWLYVERQKASKRFKSIEDSQMDFIKEFHIRYLICTKHVKLSEMLRRQIKKEIIDQKTGERFCILSI